MKFMLTVFHEILHHWTGCTNKKQSLERVCVSAYGSLDLSQMFTLCMRIFRPINLQLVETIGLVDTAG